MKRLDIDSMEGLFVEYPVPICLARCGDINIVLSSELLRDSSIGALVPKRLSPRTVDRGEEPKFELRGIEGESYPPG